MRIFILLLISMCVFAVEPRLPADKDLPGWAKQLSVKWEASWGETAPWKKLNKVKTTKAGAELCVKAEKEYNDLFATSFKAWAATAKLTKVPNGQEGQYEYNACIDTLAASKRLNKYEMDGNWLRNDTFFMAYAKLHNDPLALAFLFVPVNRNHYAATTPQ